MSERYSTDELVEWLPDAIITKLRAADRLCKAAKEVGDGIRSGHWGLAGKLNKAIAEYEGREEK